MHLLSEEAPASFAELPAPEPTLPTAVLTASGKKLVLSLPSTQGPLKWARSYLPRISFVGSTLHRTRLCHLPFLAKPFAPNMFQ